MPVPAEIIVTAPDGDVTRYKLGNRLIAGRHPECEIVLIDPMSSRRHCKFERSPAGVMAEDNGSANGTLLNGQPLKARTLTLLRNGDTLQIGSTLLMLRLDGPPSRGSGSMASDASLSIVRLEDEGGKAPLVLEAQKADAQMVSEEEASSIDITQLKRVTERLKLLIAVSQAMGSSLDPHKLLNTCLDKLFEVFPQADRGIIALYGQNGALPATISTEKEEGATLDRRKGATAKAKFRDIQNAQDNEIKLSRTVLNRVHKERQSVLVSDATGDAAGLSMARLEIKSLMCAPLLIGKDDLGIIQIETKSRQNAFSRDDLDVMTAVAGQVAIVIRNSELALDAAATAAQRENLSRFLSPQLVDEVLKGNLGVELGGIEKKGTIFFSDIVSFTRFARQMSAQNVVTLLNRYFTVMQNIIFRRGGSIDKCAGDNIMAHWGVVGGQPRFTLNAAAAAVEMQNALFVFNRDEARKKEIILPSVPLGHGIGLNSGLVCAGNIGSDRKIEFTVIGDAVNLSARIEAMAGRGQTFIGKPTWEEIKDQAFCIRMPDCPAKNVEEPLAVYSLRGMVPPSDGPAAAQAGLSLLDELLLSLPCFLVQADSTRTAGMVTSIICNRNDAGGLLKGAKMTLEVEHPYSPGTPATLVWNVPEKTSLPPLQCQVEKCIQTLPEVVPEHGSSGAKNTTALLTSGRVVIAVSALPPEISAWKPGALLQSDLKNADEIIRA